MKDMLTKVALVTTMALTSVSANAEFIKGDWKVEGEQLSAVDTDTSLEWLSLSVTRGQGFSYVNYVLQAHMLVGDYQLAMKSSR